MSNLYVIAQNCGSWASDKIQVEVSNNAFKCPVCERAYVEITYSKGKRDDFGSICQFCQQKYSIL